MIDVLGNALAVGDYIFGGPKHQIMQIVAQEADNNIARAKILDRTVDYKIHTSKFVRISDGDMMMYLLKKEPK